jgi:acetoin utilization protein AcuB
MKRMPQVREFMTRSPITVAGDTPLEDTQRLMNELGIRHFPVEIQGSLAGIVSERNVQAGLLAAKTGFTAQDVMIPTPYVVTPDTELNVVVAVMAEDKYGSAIVQDEEGHVVGIFTTVDACRVLRQFLESYLPE